jgi:hypothetical protein
MTNINPYLSHNNKLEPEELEVHIYNQQEIIKHMGKMLGNLKVEVIKLREELAEIESSMFRKKKEALENEQPLK